MCFIQSGEVVKHAAGERSAVIGLRLDMHQEVGLPSAKPALSQQIDLVSVASGQVGKHLSVQELHAARLNVTGHLWQKKLPEFGKERP